VYRLIPLIPIAFLVMTTFSGVGADPLAPSDSVTPGLNGSCAWEVVPSPNASPERTLLRGVSAAGTGTWAVGEYDADPGTEIMNPHTLTMRWDGTAWSIVPSPNVGIGWNVLEGVTAVATDDVWAVGWSAPTTSGGMPQTLTTRWDGEGWQIVDSPVITGGSELLAIDADSGEVWAVGDRAGPGDGSTGVASLAIRRTRSSWEVLPTPDPGSARNHLYAVDVVGPDDVWAVGRWRNIGETSRTFAIHWDGSSWTQMPTPNPGLDASLEDVEGAAADDVWAVGEFHNGTGYEPLTLHWDGTAWSVVENPGGSNALAVVAVDDVWSLGATFMHWDGSSWTSEPTPPEGGSVGAADVAGPCDGWAVGRTIDDTGAFVTLTMRLAGTPTSSAEPSGSRDLPRGAVTVRLGADEPGVAWGVRPPVVPTILS